MKNRMKTVTKRFQSGHYQITVFSDGSEICKDKDCGHDLGIFYYNKQSELHRLDGPAQITKAGSICFFIYGTSMTKKEFDSHPEVLALKKTKPEDRETALDLLSV